MWLSTSAAVSALSTLTLAAALLAHVPVKAADLDMDKIFRCGAIDKMGIDACNSARDLILTHCTSCHAFVPIVLQQFDAKGWQGLLDRHRERVPQLSEQELAAMREYLSANFNPRIPPPKLPEELLKTWTSN